MIEACLILLFLTDSFAQSVHLGGTKHNNNNLERQQKSKSCNSQGQFTIRPYRARAPRISDTTQCQNFGGILRPKPLTGMWFPISVCATNTRIIVNYSELGIPGISGKYQTLIVEQFFKKYIPFPDFSC